MGKNFVIIIIAIIIIFIVILYPIYFPPSHFQNIEYFSKERDYPVDIVITWLDTSDINWWEKYRKIAEKINIFKHETPTSQCDASKEVYYCIKSIRKNMPWIRNLFLFTQRPQKPVWYDHDNMGVQIIYHDQVLDSETYNGMVTCANTSHIPGLAEHYIQMDDDIYITKPICKEYFFNDGKPILRLSLIPRFIYLFKFLYKGYGKIICNSYGMHPFRLHATSGQHSPQPCRKRLVLEAKHSISDKKWQSLSIIRNETDFDFYDIYLREYLGGMKRDDVIATIKSDFISFKGEKNNFDPVKASKYSIININNNLSPKAEEYLRKVLKI